MKFDLSVLPEDITVQDATLTLLSWFWSEEPPEEELAVTKLVQDWDVYTVEEFFPEHMPGGYPRHPPDPIDPDTHEYIVTDFVREVVEEGKPNHGFMLYFPDGTTMDNAYDFMVVSCDNESQWVRPSLMITYTVGSTVQ